MVIGGRPCVAPKNHNFCHQFLIFTKSTPKNVLARLHMIIFKILFTKTFSTEMKTSAMTITCSNF